MTITKAQYIADHMSRGQTRAQARSNWQKKQLRKDPQKASKQLVRRDQKDGRHSRGVPAKLSECGTKYAGARIDPWGTPAGACVPDVTAHTTARHKVWVRGTFHIGTEGVGWIALEPLSTPFSDAISAVHSTASSTGTTFSNVLSNVSNKHTNAPYATTSNQIAARVVGCGIRIKYSGPQLDAAGSMYGLNEPDGNSIGGMGVSELASYEESGALTVDTRRKWAELLWTPRDENSYQFLTASNPSSQPKIQMGFIVDGLPAGTTFNYEITAHVEYIGPVTGKIPSHVDPLGQAAIDAIAVTPKYLNAAYEYGSKATDFAKDVVKYAKTGLSFASAISAFI
jgi:hypothetical protein